MIGRMIIESLLIKGSQNPQLFMLSPELSYMLFKFCSNSPESFEVLDQNVILCE